MEEGVEAVAFGPTVIADARDSPVIESSSSHSTDDPVLKPAARAAELFC